MNIKQSITNNPFNLLEKYAFYNNTVTNTINFKLKGAYYPSDSLEFANVDNIINPNKGNADKFVAPNLNMVYVGQIIGEKGKVACDALGNYQVKLIFVEDNASSKGFILAKAASYDAAGVSGALLANTLVLIAFIDNDESNPVILGVLPHWQQTLINNNTNYTRHCLVTKDNNSLIIEDDSTKSSIKLATPNHKESLELLANDSSIGIYEAIGSTYIKAGGDYYNQANNFLLTLDNNYLLNAKCDISFKFKTINFALQKDCSIAANIKLQVLEDCSFKAIKEISFANNYEMQTQYQSSLVVANNINITAKKICITSNSASFAGGSKLEISSAVEFSSAGSFTLTAGLLS